MYQNSEKETCTVDGGMAVQIPQLFKLRRRTWYYPVHTSRGTPTDSHFNVELLMITHFFTYSYFLTYFRWLFSLQAACLQNLNVTA